MGHPRPFERTPAERAVAWIYTGPVGLTAATAADVIELWTRLGVRTALTRLRRSGSRRRPGARSAGG